jgi:hypothetical protein
MPFIRVQSSQLKGIHIPVELVPLAIDEFPQGSSHLVLPGS